MGDPFLGHQVSRLGGDDLGATGSRCGTGGQPWRQRDQTGASTGSHRYLPSRTARKPFLLRASLRAQAWSGGTE